MMQVDVPVIQTAVLYVALADKKKLALCQGTNSYGQKRACYNNSA